MLPDENLINCLAIVRGGIQQTSHSWIIFSATPMASFRHGTGIAEATVWDRVRTSFTVVIAYSVLVGTIFCESSGNFWTIDVREIAEREPTNSLALQKVSAPYHSQQTLLLGRPQVGFPDSRCSCVSMRLRNINWCLPQEVPFFSLHPMACADATRWNIQQT